MESKEVEVSNHPVVTRARKGDVLRVMRNVGGGGGHSLTIRDFTMRITHKNEITNPSWEEENASETDSGVPIPNGTEQIVKGEDFTKEGPRDGHFCPETYMDIPILTKGLISVKMSFQWEDQGHGNRKGQIWLQLIGDSEVIADSREEYPTLAPHEMEYKEVEVSNHPVVTRARKGDVLRVMCNIGGGGGHLLTVQDFCMRIFHRNEI